MIVAGRWARLNLFQKTKVMLLGGSGLIGLASVITAAGTHLHAAKSFRLRFHPNGTVSALRLRLKRLVSDGVLVADIVRDILRDLINFMQVAGEESYSARPFGQSTESALIALLTRLIVAEDSDGVNDRTVLVLHVTNGLFQRHAA